jgi:hypothetical protein
MAETAKKTMSLDDISKDALSALSKKLNIDLTSKSSEYNHLFDEIISDGLRKERIKYFNEVILPQNQLSDVVSFLDLDDKGGSFHIAEVNVIKNTPLSGISRSYDWWKSENVLSSPYWKNIPEILRAEKKWIGLECDSTKLRSKPSVYLCRGVMESEALTPKNHLQLNTDAYSALGCIGQGYILNNETLINGLRLIAIEISISSGLNFSHILDIWMALGSPYLEYSENSDGWVILGLVKKEFPTFNANGIKIFTSGGYVSLSGIGVRGSLKDITDEISAVHAYRFGSSQTSKTSFESKSETPQEIAALQEMLKYISADCSCEIYNRVVWATLSTQWSCSRQLALEWSKTAPHRFQEHYFENLVRTYDISKSPTYGSLKHYARIGGWNG